MIRRALIIAGIVAISLVLAFPLRDAVYAAIIVPMAYIFWVLGLVYRSMHQSLWWGLATIVTLIILLRGIAPQTGWKRKEIEEVEVKAGPVETFSALMDKSETGTYSKWMVANRVGKIAHFILAHRETGKDRSFFDPITGPGWEPSAEVQSYLEAGLQGSFADYPRKRRYFSQPVITPMDHDVDEVIAYLETQIEK